MTPAPTWDRENEVWTSARGTKGGKPMLVRCRQRIESLCGHPEFRKRLRVTWRFQETEIGIPQAPALEEAQQFETLLCDALEVDCLGLLVASVTFDNRRTLTFYVRDLAETGRRVEELPQQDDPYPIELEAQDEPDWAYYVSMHEDLIGPLGLT